MAGRPMCDLFLLTCTPESWSPEGSGGATREVVRDRQKKLYSGVCRTSQLKEVDLPTGWPEKPLLPKHLTNAHSLNMRVPNSNNSWEPAHLGGAMFTRTGGSYTDEYFAQLKDDCPGCPWWKDEKPEDESAAAATIEKFIKIYGYFDWSLSRSVHSSPEYNKAMTLGPYASGQIAKRVLVMSPHVDLSNTQNQKDFRRIVIAKRVLVMPPLVDLSNTQNQKVFKKIVVGMMQGLSKDRGQAVQRQAVQGQRTGCPKTEDRLSKDRGQAVQRQAVQRQRTGCPKTGCPKTENRLSKDSLKAVQPQRWLTTGVDL
eukprot:gene7561-713_t